MACSTKSGGGSSWKCCIAGAVYSLRVWPATFGLMTVWAQAAAVVQLFGDGILLPVGECDAVIELGSEKTEARFFEAVESGERNGLDDIIVLRFSCLPEARA